MNQSTLFKMWQLIIEYDARKNMASDFAGEALDSAVEAIIASTVIEPVDVHHCIVTLDGTMTDLIVQKNGLIVFRICQEGK